MWLLLAGCLLFHVNGHRFSHGRVCVKSPLFVPACLRVMELSGEPGWLHMWIQHLHFHFYTFTLSHFFFSGEPGGLHMWIQHLQREEKAFRLKLLGQSTWLRVLLSFNGLEGTRTSYLDLKEIFLLKFFCAHSKESEHAIAGHTWSLWRDPTRLMETQKGLLLFFIRGELIPTTAIR